MFNPDFEIADPGQESSLKQQWRKDSTQRLQLSLFELKQTHLITFKTFCILFIDDGAAHLKKSLVLLFY